MEILEELKKSIIEQDSKKSKILTEKSLNMGISTNDIINAITEGLRYVGDLFDKGELFLPEVIRAANAAKNSLNLVLPLISKSENKNYKAVIAIGSLGPHDIGKSIISAMLIANNFKVIDIGININPEKVEKILKENKVDILALSILLTSDIEKAERIISSARKISNELKIMIGGVAVNEEIAKKIGADAYGKDANDAVKIANDWVIK